MLLSYMIYISSLVSAAMFPHLVAQEFTKLYIVRIPNRCKYRPEQQPREWGDGKYTAPQEKKTLFAAHTCTAGEPSFIALDINNTVFHSDAVGSNVLQQLKSDSLPPPVLF